MKWTRFMAGFDIHGDEQNPGANKVFFDFMADWKPQIRICGGDLWNFAPLRKGASEDEKRMSMKEDYDSGVKWLKRFRATHFIRGNHDERMYDLAQNGVGFAADFAQERIGEIDALCAHLKCKMLPYHKREVLRFGHLKIIHGFHCGVYAARQTALVYGSTLFGHTHAIDDHSIPGLEARVAHSCGCLCNLDMDYNSRQPNSLRQQHGFVYGVINEETGFYHYWQAREFDGNWIMPSDLTTYETK